VGFERSDSAVAVLGLEGFVLLAAVEVDGELHQLVETSATVVGCPGCGIRALSKGRRRTKVCDLSCGGRPVVVVWSKRLWRCGDADCDVKTWSETSALIEARASLTERTRAEACRRVGRDNHAVAQVARSLGVGWATVMKAVRDHGEPLVDDPGRIGAVGALGLDETAWLRAGATRHTAYLTGFVDIVAGRLLDVVAGRSARVVDEWLANRPEAWLAGVDTVAIDPHRGYANGIAQKLAHATLVVDPFHAVRLANVAIDDVRRRVHQDTCGHRGRKGDPLNGIRRLLLRGNERLSDRARARLEFGLAAGDRRDEVLDVRPIGLRAHQTRSM
jgi:transposase